MIKYAPDPESFFFLLGRNDIMVFRYADIWLMKAEALYRTGNSEALDMVNALRELRGATELDNLTEAVLLEERGHELYWEGHRRQDLVRFGQFARGTWDFKDISDDYRRVFPIPSLVLNVNRNLVQNPGY